MNVTDCKKRLGIIRLERAMLEEMATNYGAHSGREKVRYVAFSPHFDLVEEGFEIPEYRIVSNSETNVVNFERYKNDPEFEMPRYDLPERDVGPDPTLTDHSIKVDVR